MRQNTARWTFAALGLGTSIALGAGIIGAATASEGANQHKGQSEYASGYRSSAENGSVLSVEQVVAKVKEKGFTKVYEVERERGIYEVKARDAKGVLMELYIDAKTGEILKSKRES